MAKVDSSMVKPSFYEVKGKLPNPFIFDDGSRVKTPEDWERRRKELYKTAVELQFGTLPPKPEYFEVETTYSAWDYGTYRIFAGTKEKQVCFFMKVFYPKNRENCAAVIDGDMCFGYHFDKEFINGFRSNGIALVSFDRTFLAHDMKDHRELPHQLYDVYPDYTFSALGAWAWGYSRCIDALEKIGTFDMNKIAITGHSRGGKTALLAGATDERIAVVNENDAGAGGSGCYRVNMKVCEEDGGERRNEELSDLIRVFDYWFGPDMPAYVGREEELPFDEHFLKALVAPRTLLLTEACDDTWANPIGSWQTTQAACEVYKFLGAEDEIIWNYRTGGHSHKVEDVEKLVNVIKHKFEGEPLCDTFFTAPFEEPEKIFDFT